MQLRVSHMISTKFNTLKETQILFVWFKLNNIIMGTTFLYVVIVECVYTWEIFFTLATRIPYSSVSYC